MRIPANHNFIVKKLNGPVSFHQKVDTLEEKITESLANLIKRAEYEVPEYGRLFKPVEEEFKNPNISSIADTIKFSIKPSTAKTNQKARILKMEIFSPNGNSITPIFECEAENKPFGKKELLDLLKDKDFAKRVKEEISAANTTLLKKQLGD